MVVTPILFQSLIWDQRFLRPKDIHRYVIALQNIRTSPKLICINYRIVKFVSLFPHLSRYVQDLLIRVPPDNTASAIDDLEETRAFLRVTGVSEAKGLTEVHEGIYHQLMVAPLQFWKNLAEDDVAIAHRVHLSFLLSHQDAGALIFRCAGHTSSLLGDFPTSAQSPPY